MDIYMKCDMCDKEAVVFIEMKYGIQSLCSEHGRIPSKFHVLQRYKWTTYNTTSKELDFIKGIMKL